MVSKRDPIQGLVDYVLEIKPYHTKLLQVEIEYEHTEAFVVNITESCVMDIHFYSDPTQGLVCNHGWDMFPWGLLNDDSDPFNIPGNPNSGYKPYNDSGSPVTISYWDDTGNCIPRVGPWDLVVRFNENLTFDTEINYNDSIYSRIYDNQGAIDWDSRLMATSIINVGAGSPITSIIVAGNRMNQNEIGFVGKNIAIHGSGNNDGVYQVLSSTYNPVDDTTEIFLNSTLNIPTLDPNQGAIGRAVDADSPYYNPELGFELPVLYTGPNDNYQDMYEGWDVEVWSESLAEPRIGNIYTNSWTFTVDPTTDTFETQNNLPFVLNDVVYINTLGTLPRAMYDAPTPAELMINHPYYFIPVSVVVGSPTITTFKLAFEQDGAPIDITDIGSATHYIGPGRPINFIQLEQTGNTVASTTITEEISFIVNGSPFPVTFG